MKNLIYSLALLSLLVSAGASAGLEKFNEEVAKIPSAPVRSRAPFALTYAQEAFIKQDTTIIAKTWEDLDLKDPAEFDKAFVLCKAIETYLYDEKIDPQFQVKRALKFTDANYQMANDVYESWVEIKNAFSNSLLEAHTSPF